MSSKPRSALQAEEARNVIENVVKEAGTDIVSGFTDGSYWSKPLKPRPDTFRTHCIHHTWITEDVHEN